MSGSENDYRDTGNVHASPTISDMTGYNPNADMSSILKFMMEQGQADEDRRMNNVRWRDKNVREETEARENDPGVATKVP